MKKRNEAKILVPIISAYAEGRILQYKEEEGWRDIEDSEGLSINTIINEAENYRIKPEPKFRPFANAEECWNEMLKHHPFGWVNYNGYRINIATVMRSAVIFTNNKGYNFTFEQVFEECTFVDGQPFGVKMNE